ncbi:MAG TPA: cytidine deaminase [Erysipelotrichaceae bacterium]|nr:cytidine deaminase [Erysipelotrichaceae bacterium]
MNYSELVKLALEAREMAYAPYSHWKVGAALLTSRGAVFKGCNVENSGFTATSCAERTAFFKAVSEGVYDFKAIAIVGGNDEDDVQGYCFPCGVCRQVMSEFCHPDDFMIIVGRSEDDYKVFTLREMLPEVNYIAVNEGEGFKALD